MANTNVYMKTNLEDALILNRRMQSQLLDMRQKLEKLLSNVKEIYNLNDLLLKEGIIRRRKKGIGIKGAYLRGGTFYLKGNMFFKDINCRNCPNNQDYEDRKIENELFPMDLNLKAKHVWSTTDKQGVILGIKEQIVQFLTQSSRNQYEQNKEIDSEKLSKLLNMVPKDFRIDWEHISSSNLLQRHSAKTCEAIWHLFLHPSLKRTVWSEEENHKLLEAAKKYRFQNWQVIAKEVGQRSDFQCFVQYQNYVCHMLPESFTKWTKEDDKRLLEVIAKNNINGIINWSNVCKYFPHKAKTTLHTRYNYALNPDILHGAPFTPEEDLLLIAAVKEYGTNFKCIPRTLFPNRSLVQLRSHYNNVLSKRHKNIPWSLEDDIKLMNFVTENGIKAWLDCERFFEGKHTRTSCRTRFITIKKYLEKYPDCSIENIPRKKAKKKAVTVNTENWKEKIEELSSNPNEEEKESNDEEKHNKNKTGKLKKSKKVKVENTNHEKPNKQRFKAKAKITEVKEKVQQLQEEIQPVEENTQQILANMPPVTEQLQPVVQNIQTPTSSSNTLPIEIIEKPYISQLKTNRLNNYNFFKYAYNFKMNQHPCDNVQIKNENFSFAMSALNSQIPVLLENYEFDSIIPENIKQKIRNSSVKPQFTSEHPQLLPPSWSTAMGFRALCIHTACNTTTFPNEHHLQEDTETNYHIGRFRERLRSFFYSTALLSRLNPGMVGITTIEETETKPVKRKRSYCKKDEEKTTSKNKKSKSIDIIENIKTEYET